MKKIILLSLVSIIFCKNSFSIYHGIGVELTQNGAGVFYSPEIIKPNLYTKLGLHFERSNITEVDPYLNSQNPGFEKTMGLLSVGFRKSILDNYFSNNMSIHLLGEYSIIKNVNAIFNDFNNKFNDRIITGFTLQIPSGKIIKRYDICFQSINKISGVFIVRFHFLKKLI